jgi:hypothetical protein
MTQLATQRQPALPPILAGNASPDMGKCVEQFFFSAASLFEAWVTRRKSPHTQRAYREDVMTLVKFAGIDWPDQAIAAGTCAADGRSRIGTHHGPVRSTAMIHQYGDFQVNWTFLTPA